MGSNVVTGTKFTSFENYCLCFQLRTEAAKVFTVAKDQLCLIFAGKILKDEDNLATHNIKDGMTVHLVVKSANKVCFRMYILYFVPMV